MLTKLIYRTFAYFRHRLRSIISSKGYGIHSPFAFELVTDIINNQNAVYYCFDKIERQRYVCLKDHSRIALLNGKSYPISRLCRRSSSPDKDAQLLFKLGVRMHSRYIIELGTFLGFGTAYLAAIAAQAQIITIDHNEATLAYANKTLKSLNFNNVSLINKSIAEGLPDALKALGKVDLLFFDAHHTYQATLDYFTMALPYAHKHSVFIFHDIHWSRDMYKAWKRIIQTPQVTLSIECNNVGLVFFENDYQKLHYYA